MKTNFGNLPKNILGICIKKKGLVVVDLTKNENVLRVYLHELFHAKYPNLNEKTIQILEDEVWSWLDQKDLYLLGRLLFGRSFKEVKNV